MKDIHAYPAIFYYDPDGISIEFPDLPGCISCADTTEEAIKMAKDAMGLHLWGMEKDSEHIPEPTSVDQLTIESGSIPILIDVFMPPVRDKLNNRFVKKTLSIPQWLNARAEHAGVNFSKILQDALVKYLNINNKPHT